MRRLICVVIGHRWGPYLAFGTDWQVRICERCGMANVE